MFCQWISNNILLTWLTCQLADTKRADTGHAQAEEMDITEGGDGGTVARPAYDDIEIEELIWI